MNRDIFFWSFKRLFLSLNYKIKIFIKLLKLMKIFHLRKFIIVSYLISNFIFSLNRKHLLIILLRLELIVLNLFFYTYIYLLLNLLNRVYFLVIFIVLTVCEGVLGVSILVYMIRVHGKDYVSVYRIFI